MGQLQLFLLDGIIELFYLFLFIFCSSSVLTDLILQLFQCLFGITDGFVAVLLLVLVIDELFVELCQLCNGFVNALLNGPEFALSVAVKLFPFAIFSPSFR